MEHNTTSVIKVDSVDSSAIELIEPFDVTLTVDKNNIMYVVYNDDFGTIGCGANLNAAMDSFIKDTEHQLKDISYYGPIDNEQQGYYNCLTRHFKLKKAIKEKKP